MSRSRPLVALLAALLGGCTPLLEWQPVEAPTTVRVDFLRLEHTIAYATGEVAPTADEAARFAAFLDEAEVAPGDRIYLRAASEDGIAAQRQARLAQELRRRGVEAVPAPVAAAAAGDRLSLGNVVTVEVERAVATPPSCPNWTKPAGYDPTNTVPSNFGCATATNLGLMVAEPRDLVLGRRPGAADAEPGALAIERYRAGKAGNLSNNNAAAQPAIVIGGPPQSE